jgi:DNA-binding ferritin-like protein (Dps family)
MEEFQQEFNEVGLYVQPYFKGPIRRLAPKMQRNDHCKINNKKFKKCCGADGSNFCKKLLGDYLNELQKAQEQLSKNDQSS